MKGSHLDPKESFFNYLSRVVASLTSYKENTSNYVGKNVRILNLEYQINDAIGIKLTFEKRVDMVLYGFRKAHEFFKSNNDQSILNVINKIVPLHFFESINIPEPQVPRNVPISFDDDVDSQKMDQEGDEYLDDCFDSDSSFDRSETNSWVSSQEDEDNIAREEEEREEQERDEEERVQEQRNEEQDVYSVKEEELENVKRIYQENNYPTPNKTDSKDFVETVNDTGYEFSNDKWISKAKQYRKKNLLRAPDWMTSIKKI
jgi:hypothetical protein